MDVSKAEKTRLGIFVLGTLALLAVLLFLMVGKRLLTRKTAYFTRIAESVSGLDLGTSVKQNGVDIGSVTSITTDSSDVTKAIVRFEVARGSAMKTDMTATLGSYGITGLKYLEITGGSYNSPDIPAGGEVRSELSTIGKITLRADSIAYKIDRLLGNVLSITETGNRQHLDRLIQASSNLSMAMDTLVQDINKVRPGKRVEIILSNIEAMSKDVRAQVRASEIDKTVGEYHKAAQGMTAVTQKMDVTILRIQEDLASTMNNLKETMKNMNTFSRQIKENPAVLLRGENKEERRR